MLIHANWGWTLSKLAEWDSKRNTFKVNISSETLKVRRTAKKEQQHFADPVQFESRMLPTANLSFISTKFWR